ncbi:ATP-binding cassette domain-containing protein [Acrocarpospora sp. B8E8]|uniref:ATP-binding cassette domain-containing protein n=1 Tax=Acrocarpospora sp. B8E8 TaxID=3153572 RepID=UPI00325F44F1
MTDRFATADTSADELVHAMIGRSLAAPAPRHRSRPDGEPALDVRELTVRDADGVPRLSRVSFAVRPGEIVGLAGVTGSGQRELLDTVTGLGAPGRTGQVLLDGAPVRQGRDPRGQPTRTGTRRSWKVVVRRSRKPSDR